MAADKKPAAEHEVDTDLVRALLAEQLGAFVAARHQPAPDDAPPNDWRGCRLRDRGAVFTQRVEQLGDTIDVAGARKLWQSCLALPQWGQPPVWLHGDLHPANILIHESEFAAVIDFGDITSGDPATDLAVAWMLFEPDARSRFREAAGANDAAT